MHPFRAAARGVGRLARPQWAGLMAGLAHSAALVLAFDPFSMWWLAFALPLPLVLLAGWVRVDARVAVWAGVGSVVAWAWFSSWMVTVSVAGMPMAVLQQSIYAGLFVWLVGRVRAHAPGIGLSVSVPIAWVGIEMLRGEILWDGYPWYLVAHPLIDVPALASPAAVGGTYLVSLLAATASGVAADLLRRPRGAAAVAQPIGAAVLAGVVWAGSALRPEPEVTGRVTLAAVQTNVPVSNKVGWGFAQRLSDFDRFLALTEAAAAREGVEAIVWPETMFPGDTLDEAAVAAEREAGLVWPFVDETGTQRRVASTALAQALLEAQSILGVPMVVGDTGYENFRVIRREDGSIGYDADGVYNSVFVIDGGRVQGERYDKLLLTPFGEVMPGISSLPWLERALLAIGASGMSFDLSPGETAHVLAVRRVDGSALRVATPVCFEVTAARVCRVLVADSHGRRRADVILNLSNDGWFGTSDRGRMHHLRAARWRCVELATPMLRSVNTGVSAAIDARGRVLSMLPPRTDGVLVADLPLVAGMTPYARVGDAVGWVCFILSAGAGLLVLVLDLRRPA